MTVPLRRASCKLKFGQSAAVSGMTGGADGNLCQAPHPTRSEPSLLERNGSPMTWRATATSAGPYPRPRRRRRHLRVCPRRRRRRQTTLRGGRGCRSCCCCRRLRLRRRRPICWGLRRRRRRRRGWRGLLRRSRARPHRPQTLAVPPDARAGHWRRRVVAHRECQSRSRTQFVCC